jgi:hypothetical protein
MGGFIMSGQLRRPGAAVGAVVFAVNNLYCQVTISKTKKIVRKCTDEDFK